MFRTEAETKEHKNLCARVRTWVEYRFVRKSSLLNRTVGLCGYGTALLVSCGTSGVSTESCLELKVINSFYRHFVLYLYVLYSTKLHLPPVKKNSTVSEDAGFKH
jgi:hypothetical protein